jgi:hypothetical protein
MDAPLVVRFHELQTYDIFADEEIITLMATTGTGTYSARTTIGRASKLREDRSKFKDYVLECMREGVPPHEGEFD